MTDIEDAIMRRAAAGDLDGFDPSKAQFALDSPQGVIKQKSGRGSAGRTEEAPEQKILDYRLVADTDPHIKEGIETFLDYLIGSGWNITPANIVGADAGQDDTDSEVQNLRVLFATSPTWEGEYDNWVKHSLIDGTGFLEIVVENDVFKPKLLPTEKMSKETDEFGNLVKYILETPDGDEVPFEPYDIAELSFHKHPTEDFGRGLIEACEEQADMLRDMEIDMARFIATKAYPPILWQLGSEDRPWTEDQIGEWLNTISDIEPESMLAVGHDVDHDVVGVTSTSSESGAMRLEGTFQHLLKRIYTALGLPAFLGNIDSEGGRNEAVALMPKFDRRIQRYRNRIRSSIRHQIFVSILAGDSEPGEKAILPPEWEFGQHSSEEERLDADMAIKLVNNGLLTREAAAKRIGIDPETELPADAELDEQIEIIRELAGKGDDIQNPEGGRPSQTGGGADTSGEEVKTRQNPEKDDGSGRSKRDISSE